LIVSVIIANWNGRQLLPECLDALKRQTYRDFEVIVVDNGSTDGSVDFLRENYSGFATVLPQEKNLGFGLANNVGIKQAKGKYIALLNNDAVADEHWLEELVKAADAVDARTVGMFASKILNYTNRDVIDNIGHLFYPDGLNRGHARLEKNDGRYDAPAEALFSSGCAALYRKEMFDAVGLFDEDFFAYGDDTDIGLRARIAGWGCRYVPTAVAYHKYSVTAGEYSPLKAFLVERNRVFVALKCLPLGMLLLSPWYTFKRLALQAYGALTGKGAAGEFTKSSGAFALIWILIKAYLSALKRLPRMLKRRRAILKNAKLSRREFRQLLRRFAISARELALKK